MQNGSVTTAKLATDAVTNAKLADQAVTLDKLPHGTSSNNGKFLRANNGTDPTFETINTDLVADTSPQLGGNLDVNTKNIVFGDSSDGSSDDVLSFGASGDLKIFHQADQSRIVESGPSVLKIMGSDVRLSNAGNTADYIQCNDGADVQLFYNGSKKFNTRAAGIDITGDLRFDSSVTGGIVRLRDNQKIFCGNGDDLQIYHDGSNSYIQHGTVGNLRYQSGNHDFYNQDASQFMCRMFNGGTVRLYHNGSAKFETTSTGAKLATGDDPVTLLLQNTDSNTPTDSGGEIDFKGTKTNGNPIFFGGIAGKRRNQPSDVTGYLAFYRQDGDGSNNAIEAGRIDHGGHVYFCGMTELSAASNIKGVNIQNSPNNGRINLHANSSAGTAHGILFYHSGGNVGQINYGSSSTSYNTSSDYRLKENVVAISDGITRLKTLKPSRFNFKVDKDTTVDGFLAHEVTAVPEAIHGTKDEVATEDDENRGVKKGDPIYQGIDQSKLVPLLTAALQEAVDKIEILETKVAALEAA